MNAEYVTDVTYGRTFIDDISPSRLRLVAALNGFPIPPADNFDYCELGSAHGDTTAALAAANPRARFIGVDLSKTHTAIAKRQAADGQLENIRFLERDFEDLGDDAIPDLDFIAAHGVLSWIGPAKRKALLQFASAKLKPGGLLYVGYNAQPGWAAVEPLRTLLVSAGVGSNDSQERARRGLALARQLRDAGALYYQGNPSAGAMLATMEELGPAYIAHEYLNAYWEPMYFAQVAQEMAQNDLYFVGQLPLYLNYRDLVVPPSMSKLFETVTDRATFETLKDYALNEFFRRDVFIKGRTGRSAQATQAYFDTTPFGVTGEVPAEREVRLPHHTLDFRSPLFDALFTALHEGHADAATLAQRPTLLPYSADDVRAALLRSILGDCAGPMQSSDSVTPSDGKRLVVRSAYNRMVLRQTPSSDTPFILGSQVTGRGHSIAPLDAICIRLLTEVPRSNWESWTRALFKKQGVQLTVRGDAVQNERERVRAVLGEVEKLRVSPRLARWLEWRIIERAE